MQPDQPTDPKPAEPREPVTVKSPKGPFDSSAIVVDTSGSLEHLAVLLHERFRPLAGDVLIFDDCEQIAQMAVVALKHDERAAYDRGLAEGRRQATEGWERQWAVAHVDGGWVYPYGSEAEARAHCTVDWHHVVSRLVGPWEPDEQHEPARNPRYGALGTPEPYFGSDDQREPGCPACHTILNAKAAGCDGAWHADNRPASGGVVEPSGPLTAEHTCQGSCVVPKP